MRNSARLTQGPIHTILLRMTWPMLLAMVSMMLFNIVDTWFVARLGAPQVAALSFTFPVVILLNHLALGLGTGLSSAVSRAIGRQDKDRVRRLTSSALLFTTLLVLLIMPLGILTLDPLFKLMGAGEELLPYIREYMSIWYLGTPLVVIPMVGNSAIRATGDTKTPGFIMIVAAISNVILDPLFIFGYGLFPAMGIQGAAIATVISRGITLVVSLWILIQRESMITKQLGGWKGFRTDVSHVLYLGIPVAVSRMIIPVAVAILTRLISHHGTHAIAAYGIATRIEFVLAAVMIALSSVIGPFTGQNLGAGEFIRINKALKISWIFCLLYGLFSVLLLQLSASFWVRLFSADIGIMSYASEYLHIASLGFAFLGIQAVSATSLNALQKPIHSGVLSVIHMFVFTLPLAWLGDHLYGLTGIWSGVAIGAFLGAIPASLMVHSQLKKLSLQS